MNVPTSKTPTKTRDSARPGRDSRGGVTTGTAAIVVIDDDQEMQNTMVRILKRQKFDVRAYLTAEAFLDENDLDSVVCVVTDVNMPGMSGLQLLQLLAARAPHVPVIIVTGQGDIEMAVGAVKEGAFDFLAKPFTAATLVSRVNEAISAFEKKWPIYEEKISAKRQVENFTQRETEVFRLLTDGHSNKSIAAVLNVTEKTVEYHRSNIGRKVRTGTLVDLIELRHALDSKI